MSLCLTVCDLGDFFPAIDVEQQEKLKNNLVPPAALVCRVDTKDIQLLFAFLWAQAVEVLPILVQIVDQVSIEAVLGDNVDGAWERHSR